MALTPLSTFSDVMRIDQFSDKSHKDKALKSTTTQVLYQKSGFNTKGEVANKQAGATYIRQSLDREFGAGFGARVFARANTYQPGLNLDQVVKGRDLALLDRASANLRAEDTVGNLRAQLGAPAQGITGGQVQSLLQVMSDGRVRDGTKLLAEGILREALGGIGTLSGLKTALSVGGQLLPQGQRDQLLLLRQGNGNPSFSVLQQEMIRLAPNSGGNTPQNRALLQAQLPPGATVGQNGAIGGTTTLNRLGGIFPQETGLQAPRFVDVIQKTGNGQLGKPGEALSNGLVISPQAKKDFFRMNITVNDGVNAPYNSVTERNAIKQQFGEGQVETRTNESVAGALNRLGGNDPNVLRVLSSVINQQFATPLSQGFLLQDGSNFKPNITSAGAHPNGVQIGGNDTISLQHAGGIGYSQINVTKTPGGDYRVDISYPFTMARPESDHNSAFAGLGGTMIQGTAQASYTVDGALARQGQLGVTENGSPTVTWNGNMI